VQEGDHVGCEVRINFCRSLFGSVAQFDGCADVERGVLVLAGHDAIMTQVDTHRARCYARQVDAHLLSGEIMANADVIAQLTAALRAAACELPDDHPAARHLATATDLAARLAPAARPAKAPARKPLGSVPVTARATAATPGIAQRLRDLPDEAAGAAYLAGLDLDRAALLAVAAELHLTRVDRLSRAELQRRVLKQAIGARRKFAGLRHW
jgi:hypothetical protein